MSRKDFSEIAHTGGKATFTVKCDKSGQISYQIGYSHSSPRPMTLVGIYAHPDGFACGNIKLGGIGQPFNPPPFPNCITVFMASDSHGKFGHECPECHKHFRTGSIPEAFPLTCPYCGLRAESYHYLTPPQKIYIKHYVSELEKGLKGVTFDSTSEIVIDMNAVADTVSETPRQDFYYTSTTQQSEFLCTECNSYNDIRGRYGYCANCGCRNNVESQRKTLDKVRDQLTKDIISPMDAVKKSVSEFDSSARDYLEQFANRIPMKESRRNQLEQLLCHNLDKVDELLKSYLGIKLLKGMDSDRKFIRRMFLRRHVYEHDGGVATARYVRESEEQDIEVGMLIRETAENAHKLIGYLNRMIKILDSEFNEIFPPEQFCIQIEKDRQARMKRRNA